MPRKICQECLNEGKENEMHIIRLDVSEGVRTQFFDKENNFHYHSNCVQKETYRCQDGHVHIESYKWACPYPSCDFNRKVGRPYPYDTKTIGD